MKPYPLKHTILRRLIHSAGFLFLFMLLCMGAGCSWKMIQSKAKVSDKPREVQKIREVEADPLWTAYTQFTLSSIFKKKGQFESARDHLALALKADPDSLYLNREMTLLLRQLKDYVL